MDRLVKVRAKGGPHRSARPNQCGSPYPFVWISQEPADEFDGSLFGQFGALGRQQRAEAEIRVGIPSQFLQRRYKGWLR